MPETATFSCGSCGKSYSWKPELAGKKAKCKCGSVISIPSAPPEQEEKDLYDFAPSDEPPPQKKAPRAPLAPLSPRPTNSPAPMAPTRPMQGAAGAAVVGYQRPAGAAKKDHFTSDTLMDMKRDVHVPVAMLILGFVLYIAYYAVRYSIGGAGLAAVGAGVGIMTAFKAALLVGFALVIAGPVGVSFGGVGTAILKLAAIAVFSDGVTTWVDYGVDKMTGMSGGFGIMLSFPVALAVYWLSLTYLFSMDSGDSWLVVMLLAVFDMIVRWVLLFLLLALVLNWGGVAVPGASLGLGGGGGGGGGSSGAFSEMRASVQEMKDTNQLEEATKYLEKTGRHAYMTDCVKDWYAAGCKNLWFVVTRDINGRMDTDELVVEMPKGKDARAKCYEILGKYYKAMGSEADPDDLKDDGAPYLMVPVH